MKDKKIKKNRKKQLIFTGVAALTILGGTLAYFTTSDTIKNFFKGSKYETKIVESFESPDNWKPNTTTRKKLNVTNNGTINMALRATYTEQWINANGDEISLEDEDGNIASILEFNDEWTKDDDGYFYYGSKDKLRKLKPKATSSSFIKSVTFNKDIKASLKRSESDDGQTIIYESTGDGYDDAKYILTVKIDTIQYDMASSIW